MERLLFGAIADDDTGASDLAGMLAERGVATLGIAQICIPLLRKYHDSFQKQPACFLPLIEPPYSINLPPEADASAMLQALVTGRAASELEFFLRSDKTINHLLSGYENFDADALEMLALAFDVPQAAERLFMLEELRQRKVHDYFVAPDAEMNALAQQALVIQTALDYTTTAEREKLLQASVTCRVTPAIADPNVAQQGTLWIRNESLITLITS